MSNLLKETILTGIGMASLTKERAEKLVKKLVKEGEVTEKEGVKLAKELFEKAEDNKKEMEKKMEKTVHEVLGKVNLPSKKDVDSLKSKIAKLEKKLGK